MSPNSVALNTDALADSMALCVCALSLRSTLDTPIRMDCLEDLEGGAAARGGSAVSEVIESAEDSRLQGTGETVRPKGFGAGYVGGVMNKPVRQTRKSVPEGTGCVWRV